MFKTKISSVPSSIREILLAFFHDNVLTLVPHLHVSRIHLFGWWIFSCTVSHCLFVCFQHDKAKVVQTMLLVTGINTMLQTLFGTCLPTVIGGSYAFLIPVVSIISDPSLIQIADGHTVSVQWSLFFLVSILEVISVPQLTCFLLLQRFKMTMRAIQGALIILSCIQIILGYSQLWEVCSRYRRVTHSIVVSCQLMFKHLLAPIIILLFCHLRCMAKWPLNWPLVWLLVLQLPYKVYF